MQIGRKDLIWNYAASGMRILSGIVVLTVALRMLPSEEIGIWSIFLSVMTMTVLFDFYFSNSFLRNISYVYSGVKELKTEGYATIETPEVDYSLLKSLLLAMKRYYGVVALVFLLLFLSGGTFYMSSVLEQYSGDKQAVWIAWFILGGTLAYELYTYYYNAILTGRGLVKRNMQITVLSQLVRISITFGLLLMGWGIISMVLGLLFGNFVNRILSNRVFYDKDTKVRLAEVTSVQSWDIIKTLTPNAVKLGVIAVGTFIRKQSVILIAPFFLSLSQIAEYGISKQIVNLIAVMGLAWFQTFYPKLSQYSVQEKQNERKGFYIKSTMILLITFALAGSLLILLGNYILIFIQSQTLLLTGSYLFLMLLFAFFEERQAISQNIILARNEVLYYKAYIITGLASVALLIIMLQYTSLGVLSLILCTGLAMSAYLNWKLPYVVAKELQLKLKDYIVVAKEFLTGKP